MREVLIRFLKYGEPSRETNQNNAISQSSDASQIHADSLGRMSLKPDCNDKVIEYVNQICNQIRWKKAHVRIAEEMTHHIMDARDYHINQGFDEITAVEMAIADSGDAAEVGLQLDGVHKPKPQWDLLIGAVGFVCLGIFINFFLFDNMFWGGHILFGLCGIGIMLWAYFSDFTVLGRRPWLVCLMAVFVFTLIIPVLDNAQGFTLLLPLIFAPVIFTMHNRGYIGIVVSLVAFGLLCVSTMNLPASGLLHFGTIGGLLLVIAVLKGWFGGHRGVGILMIAAPLAALVGIFIRFYSGSFLAMRLALVLTPRADTFGGGFIALQIRELIGGAVWIGQGTMPEHFPQISFWSDLMLTEIIYRFGWLAFLGIISALIIFIGLVFIRCLRQRSGLGFFVSIAVVLTFAVQCFLYVIFNLGFLLTQISLPLVTWGGGPALLANMAIIGFMLSVFRIGDAVDDNKRPSRSYRNCTEIT